MQETNELGQPVGMTVEDWTGATAPDREPMVGLRCRLEPLDADRDAAALHAAYSEDRDGANWTYLPYGPFANEMAYGEFVKGIQQDGETLFFAIVDLASASAVGVASYLRAAPAMGSIEVGHLSYSPALQRTPISTEAMYLMMRRVFDDWGYRRYEWKCHCLNGPSIAAAKRLGFRYEGKFRNHVIFKGRNRDTAWLSVIVEEWPAIRTAMESWLDPDNFEGDGRQRKRLADLMPDSAGQGIVVDVVAETDLDASPRSRQ